VGWLFFVHHNSTLLAIATRMYSLIETNICIVAIVTQQL
jgi:hypothetical protein